MQELVGKGIYKSLNKKIELKSHPNPKIGKGLFALEDIEAGEMVYYWNEEATPYHMYNLKEFAELKVKEPEKYNCNIHFGMQMDDDLWCGIDTRITFFLLIEKNIYFLFYKKIPS